MNLKFLYNITRERKALSPSKDFKDALWTQLSERWQDVPVSSYHWYQTFAFRVATASLVVVLILAGSITSAYAYISPEVTVGTILYPIKQGLESVERVTKITPQAKEKFYLKTISRREAEKKVLEKRRDKTQEEVVAPEVKRSAIDEKENNIQKVEEVKNIKKDNQIKSTLKGAQDKGRGNSKDKK